MKKLVRYLAFSGVIFFGLSLLLEIAIDIYADVEIYRLPPPPQSVLAVLHEYHRFPIWRVSGDLREMAPLVFAFICSAILYRHSLKWEKENPK